MRQRIMISSSRAASVGKIDKRGGEKNHTLYAGYELYTINTFDSSTLVWQQKKNHWVLISKSGNE